jgi:hypothetical protein
MTVNNRKEFVMVYSRTKVLARRREVTSLLVRGVSPGEIAEMLKTPKQTIYNDVRVIRSGKNDALFAYTRNEIIAQLYLNAQERAKYLWRLVEEADKYYVKVYALRELRLNDERITNKLPAMPDPEKKPDPIIEHIIENLKAPFLREIELKKERLKNDSGKGSLPPIVA